MNMFHSISTSSRGKGVWGLTLFVFVVLTGTAFVMVPSSVSALSAAPSVPAPASGIPKPLPADHLYNVLNRETSSRPAADASAFTGTVKIGGAVLDAARSALQIATLKIEAPQNTGGLITIAPDIGNDWGGNINLQRKSDNLFWHISGPRGGSDNGDLTFFYNNGNYHPVLTLQNDGNVGIGTTGPGSLLTTDVNTGDVATGLQLANSATNDTIGRGSQILFTGTGTENIASIVGSTNAPSNRTGALSFRTSNDGTLHDVMFLDQNGNVGIGTDTPREKLHIYDATDPSIRVQGPVGVNGSVQVQNGGYVFSMVGGNGVRFNQVQNGDDDQTRMAITGDGNVGIGTTSPRGTLDVNGRNAYIGSIAVAIGYAGNDYPGIGYNFEAQAGNDNIWKYKATDTAYMIGLGQGHRLDFNYAPSGSAGDTISWTTGMTMKNNGNVGIGTTGPVAKLEIAGGGLETNPNGNMKITNRAIMFGGINNGYELNSGQISAGMHVNDSLNIVGIGKGSGSRKIDMWNEGGLTTRGPVYMTGGNVGIGIGTTNPQQELHIKGNNANADIRLENGETGNGKQWNIGAGDKLWFASMNKAPDNNYNDRMVIDYSTGNVGIGTTGPVAKLEIAGGGLETNPNGNMKITNRAIMFGGINNGYELNSGQISAGMHVNDSLNIVGIGKGSGSRKIDMWNEGGLTTRGPVYMTGGNVGVGRVDPPQSLFHVYSSSNDMMRVENVGGTEADIRFLASTGGWQVGTNNVGNGTFGNQFYIYNDNDNSYPLTVQRGTGNVGIGTTSPNAGLEIQKRGTWGSLAIRNEDNNVTHFNYHDGKNYIRGTTIIADMPNNARVGIGTTNPQQELHIKGNNANADIRLENGETGNGKQWNIGAGDKLWFASMNKAPDNNYNDRMVIDYSTGNVGIGTANPIGALDLSGTIYQVVRNATYGGWMEPRCSWDVSDTANDIPTNISQSGKQEGFECYEWTSWENQNVGPMTTTRRSQLYRVVVNKNFFTVGANGIVGIGYVPSGDYRLAVNGNAWFSGTTMVGSRLLVQGDGWGGTIRVSPKSDYGETSIGFNQKVDGGGIGWVLGQNAWGVGAGNFAIGGNGARKLSILTNGEIQFPGMLVKEGNGTILGVVASDKTAPYYPFIINYSNNWVYERNDDISKCQHYGMSGGWERKVKFGTWDDSADSNSVIMSFFGGCVGIGTSNPKTKLDVQGGDINVGFLGNTFASLPDKHKLAYETDRIGLDVAELFESEEEVGVGDIVAVGDKSRTIRKSSEHYQGTIVGVVSGAPALLFEGSELKLGANPDRFSTGTKPPVALAGRIPVKVSLENGPIEIGDYLTSSSKPGIAMKATEPGMTIGIALERYNNKEDGTILVFLNIGEKNVSTVIKELQGFMKSFERRLRVLEYKLRW